MEITGPWDARTDRVLKDLCRIGDALKNGIRALPDAVVREASSVLYSNVSAVSSTLYKVCRDTSTKCSSQAVGSLLRTTVEASISIFAFCRDPAERAPLFLNYAVVLKFRLQLRLQDKVGCPYLPSSQHDSAKVELARTMTRGDLLRHGAAYLKKKLAKGKTATDLLREATREGSEQPGWFRDHWWPEKSRSAVLAYEQMAWVDDVLYKWLCSSVHSDIWAASPLAGLNRSSAAMVALQFWGVSVLRLSEALGLRLDPEDTRFLRDSFYKRLQWKPGVP